MFCTECGTKCLSLLTQPEQIYWCPKCGCHFRHLSELVSVPPCYEILGQREPSIVESEARNVPYGVSNLLTVKKVMAIWNLFLQEFHVKVGSSDASMVANDLWKWPQFLRDHLPIVVSDCGSRSSG